MEHQLAIDMVEGLKSATSIQESVRNTLHFASTQPEGLSEVCAAVAEFKTFTEERINPDSEEAQGERKRVNNLINDVSRICRELTGKSIRCTSRKDGYVYEALEPAPRSTTTKMPEGWSAPVESSARTTYDAEYIRGMIKEHPLSVLDEMLDILGDRFTDTLREVVDLRGR